MPGEVLSAYGQMMPVLKAQESLRRYEENVFGSGSYHKSQKYTVKKTIRRWGRQANRFNEKEVTRKPKDLRSLAAHVGIPFEVVKVKRKKKK